MYHLHIVCKNILVYPIYLDKRGYNDLNYYPYESYNSNTNTISITKEATSNEPILK